MNNPRDSVTVLVLIVLVAIISSVTTYLVFNTDSNFVRNAFPIINQRGDTHPESKVTSKPQISNKNQVPSEPQASRCEYVNYGENINYLPKYVVRPGDTYLSIAKNVLGNPSRVEELININKELYPSISYENQFIEEGWTLMLPPEAALITHQITSGNITVVRGVVGNILNNGNIYEIHWREPPAGHYATITVDEFTILPEERPIKTGDCIIAINDGKKPKVYSIEFQ